MNITLVLMDELYAIVAISKSLWVVKSEREWKLPQKHYAPSTKKKSASGK